VNYPINPAVYKRYKRPLRHQSGFLTASARTVEDASRNQFVFDADGFLTKIRVFNGKTHTETAISYIQGKVSSLSLQSDAVLTFSYGASSATVSSSTGESMSLVLSAGRVSLDGEI